MDMKMVDTKVVARDEEMSCGLDQWLSWSMCAWILFDVVGRVVDEDLVVSGCVDVVDVTGRVADEALSGGYENGNRGRGETGGGD
ncbi:hypothetical protein IGI04_022851 [Brassica rapa subsp. trilocularis]|uniref:Uncharacterized protein n=1 Tax=Brassica rapa subsp. trilocularis TaxID=1813537 RepID=A0ABQ7M275_BRACM|nr:hypothetical protein IGI04_028600 [Brassica rapa subsp. trilocularis]KAG5392888.1 hypothetical protein IGI04_022851 [Brassica rapa subsp. trilocularis]